MEFKRSQQQLNRARTQREKSERDLFRTKERLNKTRREKSKLLRFAGDGRNAANARLRELKRREKKLIAAVDELSTALNDNKKIELKRIKTFFPFTDPRENISKLDDHYPILLFPLRIETRFKKIDVVGADTKHQLWVRVFPEEIAIDTFEELLSENEVRNARSYWSSMWRAGDIEEDQRAAWRLLASSHGSGRAYWIVNNYNYSPVNQSEQPERITKEKINLIIATDDPPADDEKAALKTFWSAMWLAQHDKAKQTDAWEQLVGKVGEARAQELQEKYTPVNLSDTPPAPLTHDQVTLEAAFVIFPKPDDTDTKFQAWAHAPKTNVLPERLVLLGFNESNEEPILQFVGNPVPSSLAAGPDPSADEGDQFKIAESDQEIDGRLCKKGDLIVGKELKWMVDFEEAVAKGMGFKIDLTPEQADSGFDRLFVLGVRLSTNEDKGKKDIETLIDHHHHSRKGFAILSQGTPTNNTEKEGSTYSWREDPDDSFDIYFNNEIPDDPAGWFEKKDGRWLAEVLGIDTKYLKNVANYYGTDQCEARAMNVALWPATLGYFMETMMAPVFSDQVINQTKLFFQRFVSGRGVIPAVRVGNQPYGILPATPFSRMKWQRVRTPITRAAFTTSFFGGNFSYLHALYNVLRKIDNDWTKLLAKVSHVGKGGDPHQILLDVVGLHPSSVEHYYRHAQSFAQIYNSLNLKALGGAFIALLITAGYVQSGMDLLAHFAYTGKEDEDIPDILKKFFLGRSDLLSGPLIDDVPLSESDPIRIYAKKDDTSYNYIQWLIDAANDSHDTLRKQQVFIDNKPPTALLYLMLKHALDLGYLDAGLRLHISAEIFDKKQTLAAIKEPEFICVQDSKIDPGSRWKHLYKPEPLITSHESMLVGSYIPTIIKDRVETTTLRHQLKALEHLKDVPTARLERVFTEHLDTCSYRLDAWMSGLVNAQLSLMRGIRDEGDDDVSLTQGLYIGAYGWLEDVRPENKVLTPAEIDADLDETFTDPEHPLMRDNTNGGYIHAPSTNHAVTAAVLRNGYLANATESNPTSLAVNLSSERVRLALSIIEGIRSGQSLAALLGYQLERGMHDRHQVEVDEFILDLRKAFPLYGDQFSNTRSGETDSIDKIEARNVINGLALVEQIKKSGEKTYPFGKTLPEPEPDQYQQAAINAEVERILDINDAVADLAIAESVHQVVQGNYDRAAATLDTYSKGNFPPTPDVIKTPRSGVTLTHRVGLQLQSGLTPDDPANTTPRSKAEPSINNWLSGILPTMDNIVCVVEFYDHNTDSTNSETISMKDLGLLPIDLVQMVQMESEQAMTTLDDAILLHAINTFAPRPDVKIEIKYIQPVENDSKVTLFELAPLLNSLRALIQRSRPLTAGDVKLAVETSKASEADVRLNPKKITLVRDALKALNTQLGTFIGTIPPIVVANIINNIDSYISDVAAIFNKISRFGMPQTGIGFLLEWKRQHFEQLRKKIEELIARWDNKLTEFDALIVEYNTLPGTATDEEKFTLLQKAERKISTTSTVPLPATPDDYRDELVNNKRVAFQNKLNDISTILSTNTLSGLYTDIESMIADIPSYDFIALDIEKEKKQLLVFAQDLQQGAENLQTDLDKRLQQVADLLPANDDDIDSKEHINEMLEAAAVLLGQDFRIVPEFGLTEEQSDEWQSAYDNREKLLKYQKESLEEEFPVDGWLYGIARVREKMHHVENTIILADAFVEKELKLEPIQLPYHKEDYWLALEYPEKKIIAKSEFGNDNLVSTLLNEGILKNVDDDPPRVRFDYSITDEGQLRSRLEQIEGILIDPILAIWRQTLFRIDEDKLLYTAYYTTPFDNTKRQCGLLIDEWTEVIPTEEETTGLTFHYDRPNSEPPQTLLLATPSEFRQSWQWQDIVDTLRETLDMAKKRAIEPGHIDTTDYARFLPALVSAVTVYPITAALNLALNNEFYKVGTTDE
jgi:hypothetical protein